MKPARKPKLTDQVLAEMQTLHVVTPKLVGAALQNANTNSVRQALANLSLRGTIHRHLCRFSESPTPFAYYSMSAEALSRRDLRRAYAVSEFLATHRPMPKPLTESDFRELAATVCASIGVPVPQYQHCYLSTQGPGGGSLVNVLRATHRMNLQQIVGQLDSWVSSPEFQLWWYFLVLGSLSITFLVQGRDRANELSRWLQRRPPVSRIGQPAMAVPVVVYPAGRLKV